MTVMIGIDPHKRTHTAVALDDHDRPLDQLRLVAGPRQVHRLLGWADRWPDRTWAVENANGLGWLLARQLVDAGETVLDVPAPLAAQVRRLSGSRHKSDQHDAHSTAVAGRRASALRPVDTDPTPVLLGLLVERRWHVVSARQKTLVRIHEQLVKLRPGGHQGVLSADKVARELRRIRPTGQVAALRRQVVKDLLAELRVLDRKRKQIDGQLAQALEETGTTLQQIDGIGPVGAATILAAVGDVRRFPTAGHFASFTGTAPVAASSGDVVRYRLNLGGDRQLNKVLHTAAKVQTGMAGHPGRTYIHRRLGEGKTRAEATRALKRHLSNVVYRRLLADAIATSEVVSGEDSLAA